MMIAIDAADRNGRSPSPWLRVAREKTEDVPRLNDRTGRRRLLY